MTSKADPREVRGFYTMRAMVAKFSVALSAISLLMILPVAVPAQTTGKAGADPIRHTLSFPAPHTHYVEVSTSVPTGGRPQVELMMAVWTPGSYLVREFERPLLYFAQKLLNDEDKALDVLQEVWFKAFRSIGRLEKPSLVRAWLYRLTRSQAIDRIRKDMAEDRRERLYAEARADAGEETSFDEEDAGALHKAGQWVPLVVELQARDLLPDVVAVARGAEVSFPDGARERVTAARRVVELFARRRIPSTVGQMNFVRVAGLDDLAHGYVGAYGVVSVDAGAGASRLAARSATTAAVPSPRGRAATHRRERTRPSRR